jgi:uncharacterized repeat protein (TIGR03803 family)
MSNIALHRPGRVALLIALLVAVCGVQFARAQTFSMLYSFTGKSDGSIPKAGLVADSAGNLYGTTSGGGDLSACNKQGCGVVFKLDTAGTYTVLHAFTGAPDGSNPYAGLTIAGTGNYVGSTSGGGSMDNGAIFMIDTTDSETILHSFQFSDGQTPEAGLTRGTGGDLYGTATAGGVRSSFCGGGCGVVYKTRTSGVLTVLHNFVGGSDGITPQSAPAVDASGNVYGTTVTGGTGPCTFAGPGCGIIYKLDPSGIETILHTFVQTDGASPVGGPTLDAAGNLYGTTFTGGEFDFGVVYKVDTSGTFSVLYSFTGGEDGSQPSAGVALDNAGNIYGTTQNGGSKTNCPFGCGVVFRIDSVGTYQVLHRFSFNDGAFPQAPLLLSHGAFYGTTAGGATPGVIFKVTP